MADRFYRTKAAEKALKAERAVLRAAMGCVNKKGHAFMFAKADANYYVIDRAKWQRLESAVANLREIRRVDSARANQKEKS